MPLLTLPTRQPEWVQTAEKALKWPSVGWVTTIFCALKIMPPPEGISEVLASAFPPPRLVSGEAGEADGDDEP
ncbi:hypothetical protein GCM10010361_74040 [Streptomyces olivaceiscleroticus]|uniref:Uncharacterized protein n=1 Tax=Streptomyces olivaceiscleroticus TaxID=68245 RepID=A0ABN1BHK6_9ACTN